MPCYKFSDCMFAMIKLGWNVSKSQATVFDLRGVKTVINTTGSSCLEPFMSRQGGRCQRSLLRLCLQNTNECPRHCQPPSLPPLWYFIELKLGHVHTWVL